MVEYELIESFPTHIGVENELDPVMCALFELDKRFKKIVTKQDLLLFYIILLKGELSLVDARTNTLKAKGDALFCWLFFHLLIKDLHALLDLMGTCVTRFL